MKKRVLCCCVGVFWVIQVGLSINLVKNESDIFIPHPVGFYDVSVNIYFSRPDKYGKVSLRASVCDFVPKKQ